MTKISFNALDELRLRPTGVYGSKTEIVQLLRYLGMVDDKLFGFVFAVISSKLRSNFQSVPSCQISREQRKERPTFKERFIRCRFSLGTTFN
jgi:hypothetical protein